MLTQFKNSLLSHISEAHLSSHSTFQKMDTNTCADGIKFEIHWVMSEEHTLRTALGLKRQDTLPLHFLQLNQAAGSETTALLTGVQRFGSDPAPRATVSKEDPMSILE